MSIGEQEAVALVTEEFDRLNVPTIVGYTFSKGSANTVRMKREVELKGPKGIRTVALFVDEDGSNPAVLVSMRAQEPPIRDLEPADLVKLQLK